MAKCKMCGAEISENAIACPHCGAWHPVEKSASNSTPKPGSSAVPKHRNRSGYVSDGLNPAYLFVLIISGAVSFAMKEFGMYLYMYSAFVGRFFLVMSLLFIVPFLIMAIIRVYADHRRPIDWLYFVIEIIFFVYMMFSCIILFVKIADYEIFLYELEMLDRYVSMNR